MRHPEFPVVSFLCIPLLLCSLPSHIRAGSVCTIALIAWLGVLSIVRGVNTLVWADNVVVKLEVWCDITTKITVGFTYAVPAAALCILRHLENVASTRNAFATKADKRRRQKFEAVMCFGVPILFMALHYVVQGHRFDLIEDLGCSPAQYISVAAILILWAPPLLISLVTMIYAGLTIRHFMRHRISFATHLRNSQASISPGRYFRLMALAIVEIAWDSGTNIYILYFNVSLTGLRPWISWDNVHSNFSRVGVFPTFVFPPSLLNQFIWQWWIIPISCSFFFIFFGFGEEAMSDYRAVYVTFRRIILRRSIQRPGPHGTSSFLPRHRSPSHCDINVAFPATPDDTSGHEPKGWYELEVKAPEHASVSSIGGSTASGHSEIPIPDGHLPVMSGNPSSFPPDTSQSGTDAFSALRPTLPSLTLPWYQRTAPQPTLPVIIVNPDSGVVSVTTPFELPAAGDMPFLPSSRSSSYRKSTSTDLGITVSQAYQPDTGTVSRYREALLNTATSSAVLPSYPEPAYAFSHDAVRMSTEKSVA